MKSYALVGNPNSGKTTLFNALTGLRQKTANYPGVTVEKRTGRVNLPPVTSDSSRTSAVDTSSPEIQIIDLPGTYSLFWRSPDERLAVDVISGHLDDTPQPEAIVVVVDASNLQRNLYLLTQLIETGRPLVVALTMTDIAERHGHRVDVGALSMALGVPVVPVQGHRNASQRDHGIEQLKRALADARSAIEPDWPLPEPMRLAVSDLAPLVEPCASRACLTPRALAERLLIQGTTDLSRSIVPDLDPTIRDRVEKLRANLIAAGIEPMKEDIEAHYRFIETLASRVLIPTVDLRVRGRPQSLSPREQPATASPASPASLPSTDLRSDRGTLPVSNPSPPDRSIHRSPHRSPTFSERLDKLLLHRVFGLAVFLAVMSCLFISLFYLAAPLQDATEGIVSSLGESVSTILPEGVLKDLWIDGIVAGVGGVLVFVPQIALLFLLLAVLEDSGYLARAAFLMDRLLSAVGLSGKAFVPLLSGFACAIPGIMATRTMESSRDRLRTIFVLPFMSCAARLPVYTLLIGAFFSTYSAFAQGALMLSLYLLGIIAAFVTAWVWKSRSREASSSFMLELPTYKLPRASNVLRVVGRSTGAFIAKAGTIIFALSVILWAMTYWPRLPEQKSAEVAQASRSIWTEAVAAASTGATAEEPDEIVVHGVTTEEELIEKELASAQLRNSIAGRLGRAVEPVIAPLGFDWKMGVGLVGAFAAREVFVSTMGIVYAQGDEENTEPLAAAMLADRYPDGSPVWTPLIAINLLIWFVIAMQCISTVAIVKRETNTWRWPILQLLYMNALAWVLCFVVFQVGSRMF